MMKCQQKGTRVMAYLLTAIMELVPGITIGGSGGIREMQPLVPHSNRCVTHKRAHILRILI